MVELAGTHGLMRRIRERYQVFDRQRLYRVPSRIGLIDGLLRPICRLLDEVLVDVLAVR